MHKDFADCGAEIVGVSPDSVKSHKNFSSKLELPFNLLSDPDHVLLEACGAWKKKKMAGLEYMGVQRSTALIGPDGAVGRVWPDVKVAGHAEEVLETVRNFTQKSE